MGAFAYVLTRPAGEIDLTGSRTDAQRQILAATRAGLGRRYRLAGLLLGNAADAEDATQEAMLRAWRSAASLRDPAKVDSWLDGILVNVCRIGCDGGGSFGSFPSPTAQPVPPVTSSRACSIVTKSCERWATSTRTSGSLSCCTTGAG